MFLGVSSSVTECFQSVTDYLQPVTELGTPKNMAVALPGMTLQPLYIIVLGIIPAIGHYFGQLTQRFLMVVQGWIQGELILIL